MNRDAQRLGRLGRGKPKRFSQAELERRKKRLAEARKLRWPNSLKVTKAMAKRYLKVEFGVLGAKK